MLKNEKSYVVRHYILMVRQLLDIYDSSPDAGQEVPFDWLVRNVYVMIRCNALKGGHCYAVWESGVSPSPLCSIVDAGNSIRSSFLHREFIGRVASRCYRVQCLPGKGVGVRGCHSEEALVLWDGVEGGVQVLNSP